MMSLAEHQARCRAAADARTAAHEAYTSFSPFVNGKMDADKLAENARLRADYEKARQLHDDCLAEARAHPDFDAGVA